MTSALNSTDRHRGCLLGLAVADAVGTTLEFRAPNTFEPISDMVGGGPFDLKPGQWTDDTSMALCLAESLVTRQGFDAQDQMERYVRWFKQGHLSSTGECFDIGSTTKIALYAFLTSGDPFAGKTDPRTAGNGSLMRLAPVPMAFANQPEEAMRLSAESSRTTHGAMTCIDACRYYAGLIIGALHGARKDKLLSSLYTPIDGYWLSNPLTTENLEVAKGSFKKKSPPDIKGTGFVVASMEAALWAFYTTDDFRSGTLAAANLGDDADTTAAIYGQLAGAFYGIDGIPAEWLAKVAMRDYVVQLADGLRKLSEK